MTPERKEESRALLEEYRTYEGAESFEILRLLAVELLAALDEAEKRSEYTTAFKEWRDSMPRAVKR